MTRKDVVCKEGVCVSCLQVIVKPAVLVAQIIRTTHVRMQEIVFQSSEIKNFPGVACPQSPLRTFVASPEKEEIIHDVIT